MKTLSIAVAILALTAPSIALSQDFGLPHFVQVDEWPDYNKVDRMPTGSIHKDDCAQSQKADRHCDETGGKPIRRQAVQK